MIKPNPIPRPQPSARQQAEQVRLQVIAEAQQSGALDRAAKLLSMAYITFGIANGYAEEATSILQPYGLVHGKLKSKADNLATSFDAYDKAMQELLKGNTGAQRQHCFDTMTLTELIDAFMANQIEVQRGPYYKATLFLPEKK